MQLYAGLQSDRPAVEAYLLCNQPVTIPPHCLTASLASTTNISASYYPIFSPITSSSFHYYVNFVQPNGTQDPNAQVTLDLQGKRWGPS